MCSDTELDQEIEQHGVEHAEDAHTPRDDLQDDTVEISNDHSRHYETSRRGDIGGGVGRDSELRLGDLLSVPMINKGKGKARDVTPNNNTAVFEVPSAPDPVRKRTSLHPLPVLGTPSIFSARPPTSPLPVDDGNSRPRPPARASRSVSVPSQPRRSLELHTSAILRNAHQLDDEDVDDETNRLQLPVRQRKGSSSSSRIPTPSGTRETTNEEDEDDPLRLVFNPKMKMKRGSRNSKPSTSASSRAAADESLSLDEELRRVSANERIADLELGFELGDHHFRRGEELYPDGEDDGVYVGFGTRDSRYTRFTGGGGGGGVPVTADDGRRVDRSGDASVLKAS